MHSCKKDNFTTDTFDEGFQSSYRTTVNTETDGLIYLKMYKDFKGIDSNNTLAHKLLTYLGTPLWGQGLTSDTIFQAGVFPFVDSVNQEVTGLLFAVEKEGDMSYNAITNDYINALKSVNDIESLSETDLSVIAIHNLFSNNLFCKQDTLYTSNKAYIDLALSVERRWYLHIEFYGCERCCPNPNGGPSPGCGSCGLLNNARSVRIGGSSVWVGSGNPGGEIDWNQGGGITPPPGGPGGDNGNGEYDPPSDNEENKKIYETLDKFALKAIDKVNNNFIDKYNLDLTSYELFTRIGEDCYTYIENSMGNVIDAKLDEECAMNMYLSNYFSVVITSWTIVEDQIFGKDESGVLHIYIDPLDMDESSDNKIFDQFLLVLNKFQLYYCEVEDYEPIDWRDYFDNLKSISTSINWQGHEIYYDYTDLIYPHYIMETDVGWENYNADDQYYWKWPGYNTNIEMLAIYVDLPLISAIEDIIKEPCD